MSVVNTGNSIINGLMNISDMSLNIQLPISDLTQKQINIGNMNIGLLANFFHPTRKPSDELKVDNQQKSNKNRITASGIGLGTDYLADQLLSKIFGDDTELGRGLGTLFSSGVSSVGNTLSNNLIKGLFLAEGLGKNVGESVAGAGVGLAGNLIGKGINSLGGNSMLSRGIGQGVATGIGTIGGLAVSNLFKGQKAFLGINDSIKSIKALNSANKVYKAAGMSSDAIKLAKESPEYLETLKAGKLGYANLAGLAGQVIGSGLQAAFGPSKEYGGRYGGITQTMDTAYDLAQTAIGFMPGAGTVISGAMALNKGLSNIFGSTSGITRQDAILGSAFMPAPVKWLNMAGAKTTDTFNNQSWLNSEKVGSFMLDAFGNLNDRFDLAREEAGKTYGTFSRGAYNDALDNIRFANYAWGKVLAMADLNELQNIKSLYMSSINNLRYAQLINGPRYGITIGKLGMKIFNNATNHNMGMRLLSAAALIDNKQMILCSVVD